VGISFWIIGGEKKQWGGPWGGCCKKRKSDLVNGVTAEGVGGELESMREDGGERNQTQQGNNRPRREGSLKGGGQLNLSKRELLVELQNIKGVKKS